MRKRQIERARGEKWKGEINNTFIIHKGYNPLKMKTILEKCQSPILIGLDI